MPPGPSATARAVAARPDQHVAVLRRQLAVELHDERTLRERELTRRKLEVGAGVADRDDGLAVGCDIEHGIVMVGHAERARSQQRLAFEGRHETVRLGVRELIERRRADIRLTLVLAGDEVARRIAGDGQDVVARAPFETHVGPDHVSAAAGVGLVAVEHHRAHAGLRARQQAVDAATQQVDALRALDGHTQRVVAGGDPHGAARPVAHVLDDGLGCAAQLGHARIEVAARGTFRVAERFVAAGAGDDGSAAVVDRDPHQHIVARRAEGAQLRQHRRGVDLDATDEHVFGAARPVGDDAAHLDPSRVEPARKEHVASLDDDPGHQRFIAADRLDSMGPAVQRRHVSAAAADTADALTPAARRSGRRPA